MKKLLFLLPLIFLLSCVSEETHNFALEENIILKDKISQLGSKVSQLEKEIEEIKYGIPKLLSDSQKLLELKSFKEAKEKISVLIEKHPNAVETLEAKTYLPEIEEEIFWEKLTDSKNVQLFEQYVNEYERGKYTKLAKNKIKLLKVENQKEAYNNAVKRNTSAVWSKYITEYPTDYRSNKIKQDIIKLEVDEIIRDKNTGVMPSFTQTNNNRSSYSTVSIHNDTQYDLTVRYSGPNIKSISIPKGETRKTTLSSGSYKIAASAGGYNYAGHEMLSGDYSSKYYITTSRRRF